MRIWAVVMLGLISIISVIGQECIEPNTITEPIRSTVIFCPGQYHLAQQLELQENADVLCNGAILNGSNELTAFVILADKTRITGCVLEGFHIAVSLQNVSEVLVYGNDFLNNEIAMRLQYSNNNTVSENNFSDNAGAIFLDKSQSNDIYSNDFYPTGLLDVWDMSNTYCFNGEGNRYHSGESGPICADDNSTEVEEPQVTANHTSPAMPVITTEQISLPETDMIYQLLEQVLVIEGVTQSELEQRIDAKYEAYQGTSERIEVRKRLIIDHQNKTTKVELIIRIIKPVGELYVYESVPKCAVQDVSQIRFVRTPDRVLQADPIMVWHFPQASAGDEVDLSYSVSKEISIMPETLVVTEQVNMSSLTCAEHLLTVPIAERYGLSFKLIIPILVAPVIIFVYLYFGRFKKHFKWK